MYTDRHGRLSILHGLKEALWHSISHTLSIDVFRVNAFPSRMVTVAYGFMVLILTNTYTANLAAFLTVDQLDTKINSAADLKGKSVATIEPYVKRLAANYGITASSRDGAHDATLGPLCPLSWSRFGGIGFRLARGFGVWEAWFAQHVAETSTDQVSTSGTLRAGWDYDKMIRKLRAGQYAAVISDDTQLEPRARADATCSLHVLDPKIEPFDLAIAFRRDFPHPKLMSALNNALLRLQESGTLAVRPAPPKARKHARALAGMWPPRGHHAASVRVLVRGATARCLRGFACRAQCARQLTIASA
jgi:Ligand-gated ion channel/Bacterial extracellular solute-binding proteins, family 3